MTVLYALAYSASVVMTVTAGNGLEIHVGGVPVVSGSYVQFAEPDWSRGYYGSRSEPPTVTSPKPGVFEARYHGAAGRALGTQTFTQSGDRIRIESRFEWKGDRPVIVELCAGLIWARAFEAGMATAGGQSSTLESRPYRSAEISERVLAANVPHFELTGPWGSMKATGLGSGWTIFDARGGYPQDWAVQKETLWFGALRIPLEPGGNWHDEFEIEFEPRAADAPGALSMDALLRPMADVVIPDPYRLPLIPKPKVAELNYERTAAAQFRPIVNALDRDAARRADAFAERKLLPSRRPVSIPYFQSFPKPEIEAGLDTDRHIQSYEIRIQRHPEGHAVVEIDYGGEEGLRHAVSTLAQVLFIRNGVATLPTGRIRDWPSVTWRGVHLFVGPQALEFHRRLIERVLVPLRFNHAVLQCERTAWQSAPGISTPMTMAREDLVRLFAMYRRYGIEPIPLIQSFGHMEWLFANRQNLDLAFSKDVPYSLDPRRPGAQELIGAIWREAERLLKPKWMHFGLDEVNMRGWPDDPNLVSELWGRQVPFLARIAESLDRIPMFWGDMALAPGQAIDAMNGDSIDHAARRRLVMPRNAWIADWHYRADPSPDGFRKSLQLWKSEGFQPVAGMWYRPENVRGFTLAAIAEDVGTLQTTWAGYESNEPNMIREGGQFGALILAGDYAWSGRTEMPAELEYHPLNVLRQLYFETPERTRRDGFALVLPGRSSDEMRFGPVLFRKLSEPIGLISKISPGFVSAPAAIEMNLSNSPPARHFWFAVGARAEAKEGEPVGEVEVHWQAGGEVHRQSKRLFYGRQVRADGDESPTLLVPSYRSLSVVPIEYQGAAPIAIPIKVAIRASDVTTGLRLYGVSAR